MQRRFSGLALIVAIGLGSVIASGNTTAQAQTARERCEKATGDAGIAACTEVIKRDPKASWAFANRGLAWHRKGEFDKAIADYTEVIRIDPLASWAFSIRGDAWAAKGEFDKAITDYTEAIRINPKYNVPFYKRGVAWRAKGELDKAIADYTAAVRIDPKWSEAFNNRGVAWKNKGEFDKAIADYSEAIRINPKYALAFNNRGDAFEEKGEFDKAIADYEQVLKLDPAHKNAQANLDRLRGSTAAVAATPTMQPQAIQQPTIAPAGKRVALVIGNGGYNHAPVLENPKRDADLLAKTLRESGFQNVIVKTDLTREQTLKALREFGRVADDADWAVIYYAGHGIEFGGANYLVPIDAELRDDRDIELESIHLGQVLNSTERAKRLRLVILDACRDNPFASRIRRTLASRSLGRGLARVEPDVGTLVVYAAKEGEVALDGQSGLNSPFATALAKRIAERPNHEVRRLFDLVRDDVMAATNRRQQPYKYGSLTGAEDFYFVR